MSEIPIDLFIKKYITTFASQTDLQKPTYGWAGRTVWIGYLH